MGIIVKGNNKCVATAVSTVRAALGYKTPLPRCLTGNYSTDSDDLAKIAYKFFPKHKVSVYCDERLSLAKGYSGSRFDYSDFAKSINLFAYSKQGEKDGHMVVGDPYIFDGMNVSLIIAAECKIKRIG